MDKKPQRIAKAIVAWALWWVAVPWYALQMGIHIFREAYRTNSLNPQDWDKKLARPTTSSK